jgi:hypothetical protein
MLDDGVKGLLVPVGNAEALSYAIAQLHGGAALHNLLAKNAQGLQRARYPREAMTEKLPALLHTGRKYNCLEPSHRAVHANGGDLKHLRKACK